MTFTTRVMPIVAGLLMVALLRPALARAQLRLNATKVRNLVAKTVRAGDLPKGHPAVAALMEWYDIAASSGRLNASGGHGTARNVGDLTQCHAMGDLFDQALQHRARLTQWARQQDNLLWWCHVSWLTPGWKQRTHPPVNPSNLATLPVESATDPSHDRHPVAVGSDR